ncbi:MAG TPA: Mut7-C RNAse domain-containing protein [Thermoplasmata archaeon]|nr:Mut7-C RNAse domain-containing protein [Thermoplasmata archaeon]
MKLICDHMLGSLARWLRFMGHDTAYPKAMDDRDLIRKAREEDRVLLTRDKELAARFAGAIVVRSDVLEAQIREVASALPLRVLDPLSRCSVCNTPIEPASLEAVRDLVPEGVLARERAFWRCPTCGKVYWQGSHWDKMIERLNSLDLPWA